MENNLIDRQAAINALDGNVIVVSRKSAQAVIDYIRGCADKIRSLPSAQPELIEKAAYIRGFEQGRTQGMIDNLLERLPSAQPEQRYTEEELRVFKHGISLSLLSKRSSQHWQYDEDTATEIKFLERLYEKVVADMRGEQDG